MGHYALLDKNNFVVQVITGRNEGELGIDWEEYYSEKTGFIVKRTSYNTLGGIHYDSLTKEPSENQDKSFRKNYAGIGFSFDPDLDAFLPPKPFDSWIVDKITYQWKAPVDYPDDGLNYQWDDSIVNWTLTQTKGN